MWACAKGEGGGSWGAGGVPYFICLPALFSGLPLLFSLIVSPLSAVATPLLPLCLPHSPVHRPAISPFFMPLFSFPPSSPPLRHIMSCANLLTRLVCLLLFFPCLSVADESNLGALVERTDGECAVCWVLGWFVCLSFCQNRVKEEEDFFFLQPHFIYQNKLKIMNRLQRKI